MPSALTTKSPEYCPPQPQTPETLDLPIQLVHDIFLRRLYRDGESTLESLSSALRLAVPIVEAVFHDFRARLLIEVRGVVGDDYRFSLTEAGQKLALDRLRVSEYAGVAPVSLREYFAGTRAQFPQISIDQQQLSEKLSDIVVSPETLDSLGPALVSQDSLFLYGPTGNGKTTIAERLRGAGEPSWNYSGAGSNGQACTEGTIRAMFMQSPMDGSRQEVGLDYRDS